MCQLLLTISELHFRLTQTEKKKIEEKAEQAHKTVAGYLLELTESKRIIDTTIIASLIIEIRKIGVNINQIAAVANTQKFVNRELLLKVQQGKKEIIDLLQKILDEVYDTEEHTLESLEEKIDRLSEKIERLENNGGS